MWPWLLIQLSFGAAVVVRLSIIEGSGSYVKTIETTGSHSPMIEMTGSYASTIIGEGSSDTVEDL